MVHIVNRLPKAAGGEISSGNNPIFFAKDANWLGEYEYKVFENLPEFQALRYSDIQGRHITSINDDGFHSYPISIFYYDIPNETKSGYYKILYYDKDKLEYISKNIPKPEDIICNPQYDQFGAVEKNLFIIFFNNPKYIFYGSLEEDMVLLNKLNYIYNTWGGNENNIIIREPSIINILENYLIFFGGLHSSSTVTNYNLIRIYYWSEDEHKLKYISSITDTETSPYKETGYFQQVSNYDIIGINCNYTSNSGFNVYYHFEKASDQKLNITTRRYYIFGEKGTTNKMYGSDYEKTGAWFWKNQLRMVSYKSGSDRHTHFSNEGSVFYDSTEYFTYPALIMGVNESQFLYIPRKNSSEYSDTKLYLYTINGNSITKEILQDFSVGKMCLIKIPGVPIIYCSFKDGRVKNFYYYCSLIKGFPILLTNGSTINEQEITSTHLSFPKNGTSLKIHLNTGGLNGRIYSQRNDDEGYVL